MNDFSGLDSPPPYLGGGGASTAGMSERMQSLLSRAVEDQMAEQRQLQTLINDVRQSLLQLQEDVRRTADAQAVESLQTEVSGVAAEARSGTSALGERLEAIGGALGSVTQAVQTLAQRLDRIGEQLDTQQQQLGALTNTVVQQQQFLAALPDSLNARATAWSTEVGAIRQEVASLGTRVTAVQETVRSETAVTTRRLVDHVDQAVLALAEALLRRRAPGTEPAPPPTAGPAGLAQLREAAPSPAVAADNTPEPAPTPTAAAAPAPQPPEPEPEPEPQRTVVPPRAAAPDLPVPTPTLAPEPPRHGPAGDDEAAWAAAESDHPRAPRVIPETPTAADENVEEFRMPAWTVADGSEQRREPPPEDPGGWGWQAREDDGGREDDREERQEKRRPWWRPGG